MKEKMAEALSAPSRRVRFLGGSPIFSGMKTGIHL